MRLTGVIDYTMDNFLCIRGFAPMWELAQISKPDDSVQRDLIEQHKGEMEKYLNDGEFTFFPEVILGANIQIDEKDADQIIQLRETVRNKEKSVTLKVSNVKYSIKTTKVKKENNDLAFDRLQSVYMEFDNSILNNNKFLRIDGNHRLSAVDENSKYANKAIPFCLLLFSNESELDKFSRALFYNINTKQIPLKMEENLKVIIESEHTFDDDMLIKDPSFGYHFYLTRFLINNIELNNYPFISKFIGGVKFTYFVELMDLLLKSDLIDKSDNAERKILSLIEKIEMSLHQITISGNSDNIAIIGVFSYYILLDDRKASSFLNWVNKNHLLDIDNLTIKSLMAIFDKIYDNKPKNIFMSMQFGDNTIDHYTTALRVVENINNTFCTNIKLNRVDKHEEGCSGDILARIYNGIENSDLLIIDLSFGNKNVYHELGYAQGLKKEVILIFNEQGDANPKEDIGSNLTMLEQLRFKNFTDLEKILTKNIINYFKLVNI